MQTASLPFSGATPISRHHSAQAAQAAAHTRLTKTRAYLDLLGEAGAMGLTDHQVAQMTGWPMSTVTSVRNGCGALVVARPGVSALSPYGRAITIWVRA